MNLQGRPNVAARRRRLDATFERISNLPENQLQVRSDFACYLCVLVSGFLESAVSEIAADLCRSQSSATVMNFVESRLRRPGNLNAEQLFQFVGSFSGDWRGELEQFVFGQRKDALDSVVANRHRIAHGEYVNLTYARIKDYYKHICELVDFLDTLFR